MYSQPWLSYPEWENCPMVAETKDSMDAWQVRGDASHKQPVLVAANAVWHNGTVIYLYLLRVSLVAIHLFASFWSIYKWDEFITNCGKPYSGSFPMGLIVTCIKQFKSLLLGACIPTEAKRNHHVSKIHSPWRYCHCFIKIKC